MQSFFDILSGREFWVGASSSIVGAMIIAIAVYAFRRSLAITQAQRVQRRRENELFERALGASSEIAPFAYGVVQARALRYFLLAVFVAYIGDILDVLWPANGAFYIISLAFIGQGLRWFYKIERNAIQIFERAEQR
ncbi:MAG TPA: hypothetical protein VF759_14400 [Allosphingosinicella sp.]|jgi:hypothetical protein